MGDRAGLPSQDEGNLESTCFNTESTRLQVKPEALNLDFGRGRAVRGRHNQAAEENPPSADCCEVCESARPSVPT